MRRFATMLVLAMALRGCDNLASGDINLLTGVQACYAGGQSPGSEALLLPDPEFGTRFDRMGPVMWPVGYTASSLPGGQVAVLNTNGGVVAMTGNRYAFSPVPPQGGAAGVEVPQGAVLVCDSYPWDFVDCGAFLRGAGDPAERSYCVLPTSYDLEAVKAAFRTECAAPSVLDARTCDDMDIDGLHGQEGDLTVPTTGMHHDPERAAVVCQQIAAAQATLGGPLGYEDVTIEGKNNKRLAECTIPR